MIRPLPLMVVGKTCIRVILRNKYVTQKTTLCMRGLTELHSSTTLSLTFQEQDSEVGVCATSALRCARKSPERLKVITYRRRLCT
jgi:hypothetical protein